MQQSRPEELTLNACGARRCTLPRLANLGLNRRLDQRDLAAELSDVVRCGWCIAPARAQRTAGNKFIGVPARRGGDG